MQRICRSSAPSHYPRSFRGTAAQIPNPRGTRFPTFSRDRNFEWARKNFIRDGPSSTIRRETDPWWQTRSLWGEKQIHKGGFLKRETWPQENGAPEEWSGSQKWREILKEGNRSLEVLLPRGGKQDLEGKAQASSSWRQCRGRKQLPRANLQEVYKEGLVSRVKDA